VNPQYIPLIAIVAVLVLVVVVLIISGCTTGIGDDDFEFDEFDEDDESDINPD
jgi:hypothetical protein